jgi:hypothetical protein
MTDIKELLSLVAQSPRADADLAKAALERIVELETVCSESYQVLGSLAGDIGIFNEWAVTKALDNAGLHKLLHCDVLPFPSFAIAAQSKEQG